LHERPPNCFGSLAGEYFFRRLVKKLNAPPAVGNDDAMKIIVQYGIHHVAPVPIRHALNEYTIRLMVEAPRHRRKIRRRQTKHPKT
jgi:hypothetical protein